MWISRKRYSTMRQDIIDTENAKKQAANKAVELADTISSQQKEINTLTAELAKYLRPRNEKGQFTK